MFFVYGTRESIVISIYTLEVKKLSTELSFILVAYFIFVQ
jgi:hypothetical protein